MPRQYRAPLNTAPLPEQTDPRYAYAQSEDAAAIIRDPYFINDLREYYVQRGDANAAVAGRDGLLRRFFRDGVFRQANTISAIGSAIEAQSGSEDQRARMARLEQASRAMPAFWQQGGRGWGEGLQDTAAAIVTDPTNLIGGVAAGSAARVGARAAVQRGSQNALRSGMLRGVGAAALTEGAISAGQEAVVDTSHQIRDINLGLQDEFSGTRVAGAAALGGAMGAGIGGLIGVPGAITGARRGRGEGLAELAREATAGHAEELLSRATEASINASASRNRLASELGEAQEEGIDTSDIEAAAGRATTVETLLENVRLEIERVAEQSREGANVDARLRELADDLDRLVDMAARPRAIDQDDLDAFLADYSNRPPADQPAQSGEAQQNQGDAPQDQNANQDGQSGSQEATQEANQDTPDTDNQGTDQGSQDIDTAGVSVVPPEDITPPVATDPATRLMAAYNMNPDSLTGTGPNGIIQVADVVSARNEGAQAGGYIQAFDAERIDVDAARALYVSETATARQAHADFDHVMDIIGRNNNLSADELVRLVYAMGSHRRYRTDGETLAGFTKLVTTPRMTSRAEVEDATTQISRNRAEGDPANINETRTGEVEGAEGSRLTRDPADAALFTTAGRSKATGAVQDIIRQGRLSGGGRTVTDGRPVSASDFSLETARAYAEDETLPNVQPYIHGGTGRVMGSGGKKVQSGDLAYYNSTTKKSYTSRAAAYAASNEPMPAVTPDVRTRELRMAMKVSGRHADTLHQNLAALNKGQQIQRPPKRVIPELTDAIIEKQDAVSVPEGEVILIRNKKTKEIRVPGPSQDAFATRFADLAGRRSPDPDDWEIRSMPGEQFEGVREMEKEDIWAIATGETDAPEAPDLPDIAEEPKPLDLRAGSPDEARVTAPLTSQQAVSYNMALKVAGRRIRLDNNATSPAAFKELAEGDAPRIHDVIYLERAVQQADWYDVFGKAGGVNAAEWMVDTLRTLNEIIVENAPNGYLRGNVERQDAISSLHATMRHWDADELAEAINFMERAQGDPAGKLPNITLATGSLDSAHVTARNGVEHIRLKSGKPISLPRLHQFYHEWAHWAFANVLSAEERLTFWRNMDKYIRSLSDEGADNAREINSALPVHNRLLADLRTGDPNLAELQYTNADHSPAELFAEQFVAYLSQSGHPTLLGQRSYWERVVHAFKAIINRFLGRDAAGNAIDIVDPDLIPLFDRLLPDENASRADLNVPDELAGLPVLPAKTNAGKAIARNLAELDFIQDNVENAMASASVENIIDAFEQLAAFYRRKDILRFQAYKRHRNSMQQRGRKIDEIIGAPLEGADRRETEGLSVALSPQDRATVARNLVKYYWDGADGDLGHKGIHRQLDYMRATGLLADYARIEGARPQVQKRMNPSYAPHVNRVNVEQIMLAAIHKRTNGKGVKDRVKAAALADATAKKVRRPVEASRKDVTFSMDDLRKAPISDVLSWYRENRNSVHAVDAANVILHKVQAEVPDFPADAFNPEDAGLTPSQLRQLIADGMADNRPDEVARYGAAYQRRMNKLGKKNGSILRARYTNDAINREAADFAGPTMDGVPTNAGPFVRQTLSYMTHRTAPVQRTLRTLTYRYLNLMGKTARSTLDNVNVMSAQDVARLAGADPSTVSPSNAIDFRHPDFKKLRADQRRLAIGLTAGKSRPEDVVHEALHTLMRAGTIPGVEPRAFVEFFNAADDDVKRAVQARYANKYTEHSDAVREELIAEEYAAEKFTEYMAERASKSDFVALTNNMGEPELRSQIMVALDRLVEYVAYLFNGLIGRDDMRQTFRRILFYGDMFEANRAGPKGRIEGRYAFRPQMAKEATAAILRNYTPERQRALKQFISGTWGENPDGTVRPYYHSTIFGDALSEPDAILEPSTDGWQGDGIYMTIDPEVSRQAYAERTTPTAIVRRFERDNPNADDETKGLVSWYAHSIQQVYADHSRARIRYSQLEEQLVDAADEIEEYDIQERMKILANEIDELATTEELYWENLKELGLKPEPSVIPLAVAPKRVFDFTRGTQYDPSDERLWELFDQVVENTDIDAEQAENRYAALLHQGEGSGRAAYDALVFTARQMLSDPDSAPRVVNQAMRDLGYDAAAHTHTNGVRDAGRGGAVRAHEVLVMWNSNQAKHLDDAAAFNEGSSQLLNRHAAVAQEVKGAVTSGIIEGDFDRMSDLPMPAISEYLEARSVDPAITQVMSSMANGRELTVVEANAANKFSMPAFLQEQSTRLSRRGMNWMGNWMKETFPARQNGFARKFLPLRHTLDALSDENSGLRRWRRGATMDALGKQPDAHKRVLSAWRYGPDSQQYKRLSEAERNAVDDLRRAMQNELQELRAAGVMVGRRNNYVPQVWDAKAITKDSARFRQLMEMYYSYERAAAGEPAPSPEEAKSFAQAIYNRLSEIDDDGVIVDGNDARPKRTAVTGGREDNIDFSRVLELEKHPRMMKMLEPYLVNDLETLLVKYFDASSRRLENINKMGINNHAFYDYHLVARDGAVTGMAQLLSRPKSFERDIKVRDGGKVLERKVEREMRVPFPGDLNRATNFAKSVFQTFQRSGPEAARAQLLDAAAAFGETPDYRRRVDAIVGALEDFNGEPQNDGTFADNFDFAEKSLKLANREPIDETPSLVRSASSNLRFFNNISLLGFTTLSSLGDVVLPLIRSGSFRSFSKALMKSATDPDFRRMIYNTGVAMENIVHERMINLYGQDGGKASIAFFNGTMLTPWTDMNRRMAGAVGYETFKTMQEKANRHFVPGKPAAEQPSQYRRAHRFLHRYGLGDFLPNGNRANETLDDTHLKTSDPTVGQAIIRFADEAIFQPNPNDNPMWAQTPIGAILFQLKSFPLMMGRMSGYVLTELKEGNFKPFLYLMTAGVGFGAGSVAIKDIVQGRGGEENRSHELRRRNLLKHLGYDEDVHGNEDDFLGWYIDGMLQMGGMGIIADVLYGVVDQAENGAYGQTRIASLLAGPSVGLAFDGVNVLAGGMEASTDAVGISETTNAKERAAIRSLATRVPVAGGIRSVREGTVDLLAGERGGSSSSRSGNPMDRRDTGRRDTSRGDMSRGG